MNDIDIIIPISSKSNKTDDDIRFALRSIEKFITGYNDIYLVGHKRDWITGVKWIEPLKNEAINRQKRIFDKIIQACYHEEVSDRFAVWNDDYYFLQPLDVKDIKFWKSGTLKNLMAISQGVYQRTASNTFKYLSDEGLPIAHYDLHMPILYDRFRFLELEHLDWTKDYCIKSLYCNTFMVKGEDATDLNFSKHFKEEEILKAIEGRMMFSTHEYGINEAMRRVQGNLYPEASRFEDRGPVEPIISDLEGPEIWVSGDDKLTEGFTDTRITE